MKVCTDACVLGAYANVQGDRILDIGTGTGLLALMVAQRNPTAQIDAVELDEAAATQATENVANTAFAERVRVINCAIQTYLIPSPFFGERGPGGEVYDRILTNPPFYTNHLQSPDGAVNRALHTGDLPFAELVDAVVRLLKKDGQWWVLLPPYEADQLAHLAATVGLRPFRRLYLQHNEEKPIFRVVTGFTYGAKAVTNETLVIYEPKGQTYTNAFRNLLQPFYLIF